MIAILLVLFSISVFSPLIVKLLKGASHFFISFLLLVIFIIFITDFGNLPGEGYRESFDMISELSIGFSFYLDGLGFLFSVIILGIGTLVIFYSGYYLKNKINLSRYYLFMMLFMTSMFGLVTSGNLITTFIFWEFTSISSFFLIGIDNENPKARSAAYKSLLVTAIGGLALLAGFILIYTITGTFSIPEIFSKRENVIFSDSYLLILVFICIGAFTKSAQMPFHFWLPEAMIAPTPVSAFLHSAAMVKAGVFIFLRLFPLIGDTPEWNTILCTVGAVSMFLGAFISVTKKDLKSILAYSTIASLGAMFYLIGIGTPVAVFAAIVFLFAHSLYKSALFMNTGIIETYTGTRDINKLSGLYYTVPFLAFISFAAALSNAGFPPFIGFTSKELLLKTSVPSGFLNVILYLLVIIASALIAGSSLIAGFRPFLGEYNKEKLSIKNNFLLPSGILALAGLLLFFIYPYLNQSLLSPAALSSLGIKTDFDLSILSAFDWIFVLSVIILTVGYFIYRYNNIFYFSMPDIWQHFRPLRIYECTSDFLKKSAHSVTAAIQSGKLSRYIIYILTCAVILIGIAFYYYSGLSFSFRSFEIEFYEIAIFLAGMISVMILIFIKSRLTAVLMLGVTGYSISLIYLMYGAPELALTQFITETLTVIIFILVLLKLPKISVFSSIKRRVRDFIISFAAALAICIILLQVTDISFEPDLSSFFVNNSLTLAKGKNVVNTIITDFRAMDTFGEIIVLAIAATGIFALLKFNARKKL